MNQLRCSACLDLDYNLYKSADKLKNNRHNPQFHKIPARFLPVEFVALKAAALRGCPYCGVLVKGCKWFWSGYEYLEEGMGSSNGKTKSKFELILQLNPGAGVRAFWRDQGEPFLSGIMPEIEFFTSPSKCR